MSKTTENRFNFTIRMLEALRFPPGHPGRFIRYHDTKVRGLSLRFGKAGQKTYIFFRRLPDNNESAGKMLEMSLGNFSDISLENARKKAEELNVLVGQGKDPSAPQKREASELIYDELFNFYIEDYAKHETRTWEEAIAVHRRHFKLLHNKKVSKIQSEQIEDWMKAIAGEERNKKHSANRAFDQLKAVINYGIKRKKVEVVNPCNFVDKFPVKSRDRFIQPGDEFARFAKALAEEPNQTWQDFFWLKFFVAARRGNVLSMSWEDISFELETWTIPLTKNGDSQVVPLTPLALQILHRRWCDPSRHEQWVFPSDRKGRKTGELSHMANPKNAWRRLLQRSGITNLRIHDLRRTSGSYMAILGHSLPVIGQALGHRSQASTAVYSRLTKDPVRQAMIQAQTALFKPETIESILTKKNDITPLQHFSST